VCHEDRGPLFVCEVEAGKWQSACEHGACKPCWEQWCELQLPVCRAERQLRVRCLDPSCGKSVPQRMVFEVCPKTRKLAEDLDKRFHLQNNSLFPEEWQVDCPRSNCIGLGYLGFDTVMCFVCEHQWAAHEKRFSPSSSEEVKRCPRCRVYIEKDGGCEHMTCRCGHEFLWSTLKMWEP